MSHLLSQIPHVLAQMSTTAQSFPFTCGRYSPAPPPLPLPLSPSDLLIRDLESEDQYFIYPLFLLERSTESQNKSNGESENFCDFFTALNRKCSSPSFE